MDEGWCCFRCGGADIGVLHLTKASISDCSLAICVLLVLIGLCEAGRCVWNRSGTAQLVSSKKVSATRDGKCRNGF